MCALVSWPHFHMSDMVIVFSNVQITVERTVLEQSESRYELHGEYVLPGTRDRNLAGGKSGSLFERSMVGHLGSVISSMGRWRMRLEVPRAEVVEMLPLARLISRSTDPAVHTRSKVVFHLHVFREECAHSLIIRYLRKIKCLKLN